jgi:hypothetical protein
MRLVFVLMLVVEHSLDDSLHGLLLAWCLLD